MTTLKDIPKYGFGTAYEIGEDGQEGKISEEEFRQLLDRAAELGCRHFDCAPLYGTQRLVGDFLNDITKTTPRSEFFITSKLPINMMHDEHIERSIKQTLEELQLDYLDLFLIHAPFATKHVSDDEMYPLDEEGYLLLDETENLLESAWSKLGDLKKRGLVRYIGLSNVNLEQLFRLSEIHRVDVAQNEFHLYHQDRRFFDQCDEVNTHYEGYAAFGSPARALLENKPTVLTDPDVTHFARKYNLTNAEVIIEWLHSQPMSYIIRSDTIAQLEENLKATSNKFLSGDDMIDLDALNRKSRLYRFDNYKGITRHKEYPFTAASREC